MTQQDKEQLKLEIDHIFESGANEIRIFEMVVNFIDSRNGVNKNFALADVIKSLPSQEEINEQIDKYAFRVPYDGSNNFYDEVALKHYKAGIEWLLGRIRGNGE